MRPTICGDTAAPSTSRSRKSSAASAVVASGPTEFFLATGAEVDRAAGRRRSQSGEGMAVPGASRPKDSVYGVQSLEDALAEADLSSEKAGSRLMFADESGTTDVTNDGDDDQDDDELPPHQGGMDKTSSPVAAETVNQEQQADPPSVPHTDSPSAPFRHGPRSVSQPLTPLQMASPAPDWGSALPSTPKSGSLGSMRLSDEDSQAEHGGSEDEGGNGVSGGLDSSVPQLVMPSLSMPSRRPFTDKGRNMGRLRICVVGRSGMVFISTPLEWLKSSNIRTGSGKSSLVKAIVQQCEDIVHVDSLVVSNLQHIGHRGKQVPKSTGHNAKQITEIYASTKSYPSWWSDVEDGRVLKRRCSNGEVVLDRNICFIDTPGTDNMDATVDYMENSFRRCNAIASWSDGDLLNLLSGTGGALIDVAFYLIEDGGKSTRH